MRRGGAWAFGSLRWLPVWIPGLWPGFHAYPSSLLPGLTLLYPLGTCSLYSSVYFLEYSFYFSGSGTLQVFLMGIPLFS